MKVQQPKKIAPGQQKKIVKKRKKYTKVSCLACKKIHRKCDGEPDEPCSHCIKRGCKCIKIRKTTTRRKRKTTTKKAKAKQPQQGLQNFNDLLALLPELASQVSSLQQDTVAPTTTPQSVPVAFPPVEKSNPPTIQTHFVDPQTPNLKSPQPMWSNDFFSDFPKVQTSEDYCVAAPPIDQHDPLQTDLFHLPPTPTPPVAPVDDGFDDFFAPVQKKPDLTPEQIQQLICLCAIQAQQKRKLEKDIETLKQVIVKMTLNATAAGITPPQSFDINAF